MGFFGGTHQSNGKRPKVAESPHAKVLPSTNPEPLSHDHPVPTNDDIPSLPPTTPKSPQVREETVEPILIWDDAALSHEVPNNSSTVRVEKESWEQELEEERIDEIEGLQEEVDIRPWDVLREQVKSDLKKAGKQSLPLSKINQLLILRNFATLRLKGFTCIQASNEIALQWHEGDGTYFARRVRALARYYQVFEQLPKEKRGGARTSQSLLSDESTERAARAWLTAQKIGTVTPKTFRAALNDTILPSLGIQRKTPLCTRTARRWMIKLGWRLTTLKKGVYVDGHERSDVIAYRKEVFLPAMAKWERRMARYEGEELRRVEPDLLPEEKKIIAQFHDETGFHVNDFKTSLWSVLLIIALFIDDSHLVRLKIGQIMLRKKGRGRLIHISDFINQVTGRLVCRDVDGKITRDARRIIFPGSGGDDWWDTKQLLAQLEDAISIFEEAHPNCVALFIFDQSSAHASLPPDALRAFEMNKSNGGRQRKQKDTIIPSSSPDKRKHGLLQKMTLPDGSPKGLEVVLTERGFDVTGMRAKCKPVCPFENNECCMARLLSKEDDFINQISMLEELITRKGHLCIFLPKFHCELNPIEMVCLSLLTLVSLGFIYC
jgi:hypothetical protein